MVWFGARQQIPERTSCSLDPLVIFRRSVRPGRAIRRAFSPASTSSFTGKVAAARSRGSGISVEPHQILGLVKQHVGEHEGPVSRGHMLDNMNIGRPDLVDLTPHDVSERGPPVGIENPEHRVIDGVVVDQPCHPADLEQPLDELNGDGRPTCSG